MQIFQCEARFDKYFPSMTNLRNRVSGRTPQAFQTQITFDVSESKQLEINNFTSR